MFIWEKNRFGGLLSWQYSLRAEFSLGRTHNRFIVSFQYSRFHLFLSPLTSSFRRIRSLFLDLGRRTQYSQGLLSFQSLPLHFLGPLIPVFAAPIRTAGPTRCLSSPFIRRLACFACRIRTIASRFGGASPRWRAFGPLYIRVRSFLVVPFKKGTQNKSHLLLKSLRLLRSLLFRRRCSRIRRPSASGGPKGH